MRIMGQKTPRIAVLEALILAGIIALLAGWGKAEAQEFTLTLFHNNDGESQLLPDGDQGGIGRYLTRLDQLRAELTPGQGALTVSSGDNFLAGPVFNASLANGVPYYDTMALQMVDYDAICLGNHDFDFGPDVLAQMIGGFTAPVKYLSANLDFSLEPGLQAFVDSGVLAGSTIVNTGGRQVGVVGATTESLSFISSPRNVVINDVATSLQAEIDALTAAGVDIIVVISHLQSVLEDLALAPLLEGVDIMVAGGGDDLLADADDPLLPGDEGLVYGSYPLYATDGAGRSVPVVTTSGNYRYVGRLTATFDTAGELVDVNDDASGPVRVIGGAYPDAVVADTTAESLIEAPLNAALADLASQIVARSEVELDGLRPHVRTQETNQGNLIADALLWSARQNAAAFGVPLADVALQNGGGIRNNELVPAGDISALKVFDMLPFANFLTVVPAIPRAQFKEILENCVSRVEFTDGRFGQIAGFSFTYDLEAQGQVLDAAGNVTVPGLRIREVRLGDLTVIVTDGQVLDGPDLTVATIDFLARGGDQYPFRGAAFTTLGQTYQQALASYLTEGLGGLITAAAYPQGGEGRISLDGTVAIDAGHGSEDPAEDADTPLPNLFLGQNYPNPFNPSTSIMFSLDRDQPVRLEVFDLNGRLVKTLVNGTRPAGAHQVIWNGTDNVGNPAASGVFLYRLVTDQGIEARTMTLLK